MVPLEAFLSCPALELEAPRGAGLNRRLDGESGGDSTTEAASPSLPRWLSQNCSSSGTLPSSSLALGSWTSLLDSVRCDEAHGSQF